MTNTITIATRPARKRPPRNQLLNLLKRMLRSRVGMIGFILMLIPVLIAVIGPFFMPVDPSTTIGPPSWRPSAEYPLGTDYLGRDVLSRLLGGGLWILGISAAATAVGIIVGSALGLIAGYRQGLPGQAIMRSVDVVLSFPPILLALLFMSIIGPVWWMIIITVALSHIGPVARVVESSTLVLAKRGFVQYGEMIGMQRGRLLFGELLPNIVAPLTVQVGIRLSYSIAFVGALAYLGYGRPSPDPDWGAMIAENQINLITAPLPVLAPMIALAFMAIGTNLLTDAFGRAAGIDLGRTAE